ncbi:shikimate kinase [Marinomonas sp. C2222]|uniref:Shikimate kinase n=1 Tax=Marinomonas sargassi TaxID=2984494 RepID=A0ABT2YTH4_9GAMM|nr:shikimate kinase [Marinomonas sargassi]MCV2403165.1 shikimate kinase [Marinomonas sargassi]
MKKVIILGNSGSGKSTLAKQFESEGLAHLDLDTIAWDLTPSPIRKPLEESEQQILSFMSAHSSWVIEGCYADLLDICTQYANQAIFMDLEVSACIKNAESRPWEPHKYPSKEAQDKNLAMLIEWISQYPIRTDTFSRQAHQGLYEKFAGDKTRIVENSDLNTVFPNSHNWNKSRSSLE